jgi:hypothetical protein
VTEFDETSYHCADGTRSGILGAYGGIDIWSINAGVLTDADEQLSVSLHERLHHALQHSTPWGLLARFSADLARNGTRPEQFTLLAQFCREASRKVHETYATTLSLGGDASAARVLRDNQEYRDHLGTGMRLSGGLAWESGRFLIDLTLRACMAADALEVVLVRGLAGLRIRDLDTPLAQPDARLAQVLRWVSELPDDAVVALDGSSSSDDLGASYDRVAACLTGLGVPTSTTGVVRSIVQSLCDDVAELAPEIGERITIATTPDHVLDRAEEFQRESIRLDAATGPLPLELVPMERLGERAADFTRDDDRLGRHVLLVWMRTDLLARQFAQPNALTGERGFTLALQASGRDDDGLPVVRLGLFDTIGPGDVVRAFGMPVVFFTTTATIVDTPPDRGFVGVGTVYALVDQPVVEQLRHTFDQGASVRWHTYEVTGDRRLHVVAWIVSALQGTVWLHLATEAGFSVLTEWLAVQANHQAVRDPAALDPMSDGIDVVVQHLLNTWSFVDQEGGRVHG